MPNDRIDKVEIINDWIWQSQRIAYSSIAGGVCHPRNLRPGARQKETLELSRLGNAFNPDECAAYFRGGTCSPRVGEHT